MPEDEKSVFINCPFDNLFEPLFHAIVLTVAASGFIPRCAREWEGEAMSRRARIDTPVYRHAISDLDGFDASAHDETPATVIGRVQPWLSVQPDLTEPSPAAKTILASFPAFRDLLGKFQEDSLGTLTWWAIVNAAGSVVAKMN